MDVHGRLVVDERREHLAAGRRNRGVAQDDLRHHAAHRLDAERQRRHVEQQHLAVAGHQDVGLHGGAERDDLVGVQLAVRRPAEQLADQATDERDARRAADEHDLVDLRRAELGVGERLTARLERAVDDRPDERVELRARDPLAVAADTNLRFLAVRQIELGLDDGLPDGLDLAAGAGVESGCVGSGFSRIVRSSSTCCIRSRSMSSPPRCVSPLVDRTWKTPSSTRRMEMSNVPPPKSYTAMSPACRLSRP